MPDPPPPPARPSPPPIGPDAVVRPRAAVTAVAVGSVGLLIDTGTRQTYTVNRTALAVWAALDGTTPLGAVVADLAAAFGLDPATVAPDVHAVIDHFHTLGLVAVEGGARGGGDPVDDDEQDGATPCFRRDPVVIDGHRYVLVPPSACQAGLDSLGWAPVRAVAVGDHRLGVRGQSPATDALLQRVLARHLVDDPRVPANFSVVVLDEQPPPESPHLRNGLYEANQWVGGSTEPVAVVEALVRRLAATVPDSPPRLRLEALGVVGELGVVLTPWYRGSLDPRVVALGERPGGRLLPAPQWLAGLQPDPTGSASHPPADGDPDPVVVVEPTSVQPELASLARDPVIASHDDAGSTTPRPVLAVVLPGPETARLDHADAVAALVPLLALAPLDRVDTLVDLLVDLTARVPVLTAAPDDLPDVIVALTRERAG